MHVHHAHEQPCGDDHGWPDWLLTVLATIDRSEIRLMSAVQDQIDQLSADLSGALNGISAEIDALKAAQAPAEAPVDLSGLEAAVARAKGLVPADPAPAAPVAPADPVPAPETPVVEPTVPADSVTPAPQVPSVPLA